MDLIAMPLSTFVEKLVFAGLLATITIVVFSHLLVKIVNRRPKRAGVLEVDTSDPEKDTYQLVVEIPIEELPKRKKVTFEVKTKS